MFQFEVCAKEITETSLHMTGDEAEAMAIVNAATIERIKLPLDRMNNLLFRGV